MNRILTIILLFVVSSAFSQGKVIAKKGNDGLRLKWFVDGFFTESSVQVERSEDNGNTWKNITPNGVSRDLTVEFPGGEEGQYLDALKEAIEQNPEEMRSGIGALMIGQSISLYTVFAKYAGVYYVDTEVDDNTTYLYRVVKPETKEVIAISESFKPNDIKAIPVLSNIKVDQRDDVLSIGWTPNPLIEFGANIYKKSGDGDWEKANVRPVFPTISENEEGVEEYPEYFYNDTNIVIGVTYQYKVVGIDYFGEEGTESQSYEVTFIDPVPPPAVDVWTLSESGDLKAFSNWTPVLVEDLAGYRFYYRQFPDTIYTLLHEVEADAFEAEYEFPGIGDYDVVIAAVDQAGNETRSSKKIIEFRDKIPPAIPTNVRIEPASGQMKISWKQAPTPDLQGFWVYRGMNPMDVNSFMLLNATPTKDQFLIDDISKRAKNKFSYRVVAIDTNFNVSEMSMVASASQPDSVAPNPPLTVRAEWSKNQEEAIITWSPVLENDLKGYLIYRTDASDKQIQLNISPINVGMNSYPDREVFEDGTYRYQVASVDSAGNISAPSEAFEVVVKQFNQEEELEIKTFKHKHRKGSQNISLEWAANNNDASTLRGWVLYRKVNDQPLKPYTGLITENEFDDKKLEKGKTYTYQLRLYSTSGEIKLSNEISISIENE